MVDSDPNKQVCRCGVTWLFQNNIHLGVDTKQLNFLMERSGPQSFDLIA